MNDDKANAAYHPYSDAAAKPEAISGHAATPAPLPPEHEPRPGNYASYERSQNAAPGWYPYGDGTTRWWTGVNWLSSAILQDQGPRSAASEPQPRMAYVVPQRAPMNHTFHLLMSLVTLGVWVPVWVGVAIIRAVTK